MTINIRRCLKYSDIFRDTPADLDEYLSPLGKADLFKAAAFFIKMSTKPHNFPSATDVVFNWFAHDLDFRDHITSKISPEYDVLNIISSLRFTEYVFKSDFQVIGNLSPPQLEKNSFIAYLIFNEEQEIE